MSTILDTKIEFLKGIGPQKASLLNTELRIFTFEDLLYYYPFRHEDRSKIYAIKDIHEDLPYVQVRGRITGIASQGVGPKKRLIAYVQDETGILELVWFQGAAWIEKNILPNTIYIVFGKPNLYGRKLNVVHPEMEVYSEDTIDKGLQPVYNVTEKLKARGIDSKALSKLTERVVKEVASKLPEIIPAAIIDQFKLISRAQAMEWIHVPPNAAALEKAKARLKFEELFLIQIKLLHQRSYRKVHYKGFVFNHIPTLNVFYKEHLPFDLTDAQKRVVKEIYKDVCSGTQMNRLLQGDVGSGKTIVGFLCMLMAIDNGYQACLIAPTEILAAQHYEGLKDLAAKVGLTVAKLTGSSKKKERDTIHRDLLDGSLNILIGTHAILEDIVQFKELGICIIDEQHRFGVAQRAKLWKKNKETPPHILVMTATPIPRTLAMTLYGDLDISVIDQMPAGRKPISTSHKFDKDRLLVFGFIRKQIQEGRQVYIVYPLIEESEKLDLKDLMDGFESINRAFPEFPISILHGRMKPADKDFEMQRFVKGETKIMVATTVIEVGVNVPNASVMVIENAERFGLSQLHQLRGRVGRGADQSYCILMTSHKLSANTKTRLETMVRTTNGFEIADVDLKLRGPGDMAGTQQSGVLDLRIADLAQDSHTLQHSRQAAMDLLDSDPDLLKPENRMLRSYMESKSKNNKEWSRIS
jgi:ATP-dependent DNA helicase RecG